MNKIRENLYLGDLSDAEDEELLKNEGITAVLNVAFDINNKIYNTNIKSVKIGLIDDSVKQNYMIILAVHSLCELINNGNKVLVHCAAGISRSPFIIANYLALKEGKSIEVVYEELKDIRPIVDDDTPLWWGKNNE